ncbi:hypothetical protein [uncultured Jannaschia sp.]|uniref:hypothetical protein n=1 Tax=uncultured Jannaschia sp. TaxID=293347 RepID=UPI0026189238|nr:hypothetical protein [uncultured Jannaschia sp.]
MIRPLAALLILSGCVAAPASQPDAPSRFSLVPAPGGLDVAGSGGREIGFGRDRDGVLQSVARVEGRAPRPVACGGGRDAFAASDDLTLVFEGRRFVGWSGAAGAAGRTCA